MEQKPKLNNQELELILAIIKANEATRLQTDSPKRDRTDDRRLIELNFKQIQIIEARFEGKQELRFESENIPLIGIGFQLHGNGKTWYDGYDFCFEMQPSTYNVVYQNDIKAKHEIICEEGFQFLHITFTPSRFLELISSSPILTQQYTEVFEKKQLFILHPESPPINTQLMQSLNAIRQIDYNNPLSEMLAEAIIMSIIVHVHSASQKTIKEKNTTQEIKQFLEENYLESLSLKSLSRKFGVNEFDLKRDFKSQYNNTIFGYVQQLRMQRAKELLLSGKSIKEVAFEIGYEYPQHFSTAFKKWFNIQPSALK